MRILTMMGALAIAGAALNASELKNGDSVAFLGDSITQYGWQQPTGYVRMCETAFKANGLNVKVIPAGVSGHKSNNMLARVQKDVISKKPTWMTLSCGVNDVWHGPRGVKLEDYKKNISSIVDQAQKAGIKVVILTATMITEDANHPNNKKLIPYNDFLRSLAKEKNCKLIDLDRIMRKTVADYRTKTGRKSNFLTVDGVHMDFLGNRMMTENILKDAFAFTPEELAKFENGMKKMNHPVRIYLSVTGGEYMKLSEKALAEKKAVIDYIASPLNKKLKELAK